MPDIFPSEVLYAFFDGRYLRPGNTVASEPVAGMKATAYASLDAAVAAIAGTETTLVIDGPCSVINDLSIPYNLAVEIKKGAVVTIPSGKILSINGSFQAGRYQCFTGSGKVSFGADAAVEMYPNWWGAKCDGVTDDTLAAQAALDCAGKTRSANGGVRNSVATESGSGVVSVLGALLATQLIIPTRVILQGLDWRTSILIQKNGSNKHFIIAEDPATSERSAIKNIYVNGNKANQIGVWDGIRFDSTGSLIDRNYLIDGVYATNCSGNGISLIGGVGGFGGGGESRVINSISAQNDGYGIYGEVYDTMYTCNVVWFNGLDGMRITGSNSYISNCKAWYNGALNAGVGFRFHGDRITYSNLSAQDNYGSGFTLVGISHTGSTLSADNNGRKYLTDSSHVGVGYNINSLTNSKLSLLAEGWGATPVQSYSLSFYGACSGNDISLLSTGAMINDYLGDIGADKLEINGELIVSPPITSSRFTNRQALDATLEANHPALKNRTYANWWDGTASQAGYWEQGPEMSESGVPIFFSYNIMPINFPEGVVPAYTLRELGTADSTSGNFSSTMFKFSGCYWDGSVAKYTGWNLQAHLGAGTTPVNILEFTSQGTTGISYAKINGAAVGTRTAVPATATTPGIPGQWAADTSYFYVYIGDGSNHVWLRSAVATW